MLLVFSFSLFTYTTAESLGQNQIQTNLFWFVKLMRTLYTYKTKHSTFAKMIGNLTNIKCGPTYLHRPQVCLNLFAQKISGSNLCLSSRDLAGLSHLCLASSNRFIRRAHYSSMNIFYLLHSQQCQEYFINLLLFRNEGRLFSQSVSKSNGDVKEAEKYDHAKIRGLCSAFEAVNVL